MPKTYDSHLQAGLELLQSGRAADRSGAWGEAFTALAGAADSFASAVARDSESHRATGNWGNALLEMGQVGCEAALVNIPTHSTEYRMSLLPFKCGASEL